MACEQEAKRLGEGGLTHDVESEVVDPLVQVDPTSRRQLNELGELLPEERYAGVDVGLTLEKAAERVSHGDVSGSPHHLLVVRLGHRIDIARVGKAEDLVPIRLRGLATPATSFQERCMHTLSIELCRTSCTASGSLMLTSLWAMRTNLPSQRSEQPGGYRSQGHDVPHFLCASIVARSVCWAKI